MMSKYSYRSSVVIVIAALTAAPTLLTAQTIRDLAMPERVQFRSEDGKTALVGYVFKPSVQPGARVPAVVMMHGRAGPYSFTHASICSCTS
jgi:dipeptidyl aminopeptidase/acylaminoacyl peptidase